jgi:hypothetical protein
MLQAAVARLLGQTVPVERVTVVTDGDAAAAAGLPDDPRLRIVPNAGPPGAPGARNTGLALATAEWLVFHDDDDLWDERYSEVIGAACERADPDVVAVFPGFRVGVPGRPARAVRVPPAGPSEDDLLERNLVGPCTFVACRRRAVVGIGGFDSALPGAQDWDLWLRLAGRGRLLPVDACLGTYRTDATDRISSAAPSERLRRYTPFFEKRQRHPLAHRHVAAFAAEIYWWGVLMAWTGDAAGAVRTLSWSLALRPASLKARVIRAIAASPLRRPLLQAVYGRRRSLMRLGDRDELLELS